MGIHHCPKHSTLADPKQACRARAGHLKRDPNSDTAAPDPNLPNPTCLVNITWVVARSNPDRSESQQSAEARPCWGRLAFTIVHLGRLPHRFPPAGQRPPARERKTRANMGAPARVGLGLGWHICLGLAEDGSLWCATDKE